MNIFKHLSLWILAQTRVTIISEIPIYPCSRMCITQFSLSFLANTTVIKETGILPMKNLISSLSHHRPQHRFFSPLNIVKCFQFQLLTTSWSNIYSSLYIHHLIKQHVFHTLDVLLSNCFHFIETGKLSIGNYLKYIAYNACFLFSCPFPSLLYL